ncbi:MAG: putative porin [Sphingobacteriales bacterium]
MKYILLLLICAFAQTVFAQSTSNPNYPGNNPNYPNQQRMNTRDTGTAKVYTADQQLDTLRKKLDKKKDTVVFSSKFIRYTNERLLKDSTRLLRLDTGLYGFENYSPLDQPRSPRISLGNTGRDERSLLYEPSKTIGFDAGLHTLDAYLLNPQDINYYRARVPYTDLYMVTGGLKEQIFKVLHTQNVNPQLNVGFNLNFIGSQGFYSNVGQLLQNVSDVNVGVFSWYESKNKRYNLLGNFIYNNLKTPETGSILKDSIFKVGSIDKTGEPVRLPNTYGQWTGSGIYLKQSYYIGRIDSLKSSILPTQRVAYTLNYNTRKYNFKQNDPDTYNVFPDYYFESNYARDSLTVTHLQNDFSYSFYLRSKNAKFIKNEVKLDLGLTQDYYQYNQSVRDTALNQYGVKVNQATKVQGSSFQDITLKVKFSYRLNDRMGLEGDLQQIAQGRDAGDFLYDAKLNLAGNSKAGRIVFEGYSQSSAPPMVYTNWISDHFIFHNKFKNQKTNSVSFNYINDAIKLDLKAEYFLISDYLYFAAQPGGIDAAPAQIGADINLLKVSLGKSFAWHRWHFDDYIVYQKTDFQSTLRTPEFYNYCSLYYKTLLFNVLYSNIGINVRYNSEYVAPSYATGLGQFYNGTNVTFSSYPIATVFFKATLQHTNFFLMYDYVNQGLLSPGYYTVNRYPQMDRILKVGVSWLFYN